MNRSPRPYPMHRDADAGGAADLQTDIMRFMAILSLCLVAIFALVQSIPLAPAPEAPPVTEEPSETPHAATPSNATVAAPDQGTAEPLSAPDPAKATPGPSPTDVPAPITTTAARAESEPVEAPPVDEGFTLRFASDLALTRLVARHEIGLYAVGADKSLRMNVSGGQFSFWPASVPNQFHEMDARTVPTGVVDALRRSGALPADAAIRWGVTLPAGMRRQLDGYLAEHSGGTLVIEPDGKLALDP